MREFDGDVPRHAFPLVLPKPYGFEEAVRRGRALRRRRTAGAGAGVMTLVLGVLGASVLSRGPQTGSNLKFTDRTGEQVEPRGPRLPVGSDQPSASPSAQSRPTDTSPVGGPRTGGDSAMPGVVVQDGKPVTPPVQGAPTAAPARKPPAKPDLVRSRSQRPNACTPVLNPATGGWCTQVQITGSQANWHMEFRVCRDVGADHPGGLQFRTEQQADLIVVNEAGDDVWRWSLGRTFGPGDGNATTVQRGDCEVWSLDWSATDDWGKPLPSGTYTLRGWSLADGFDDRAPSEQTFTR